jgi:Peptidase family M23
MRARPVRARSVGAAVALSVVLVAVSAGEARAAPGWAWPVEGGVITPYSNDDGNPYAGGVHRGIDIAARVGAPVRAARAGVVTYAGALGYSGLTVAVRTVDGYVTSYLHLSVVGVRRGESVGGGDRLGEVGATGRRSKPEPHLHFGVRIANEEHHYVDPLSLLPPPAAGLVPSPVPVPAPARAAPDPVPVRAAPSPRRALGALRPAPRGEPAPVHLPLPVARRRPLPAPRLPAKQAPVPVAHQRRAHPVPVSPAPERLVNRRTARLPAPAPQARARDWGRPIALGGLFVLALALFGKGAIQALRRFSWTALEPRLRSQMRCRSVRCVRSITQAAKAVLARG